MHYLEGECSRNKIFLISIVVNKVSYAVQKERVFISSRSRAVSRSSFHHHHISIAMYEGEENFPIKLVEEKAHIYVQLHISSK